MRTNLIKTELTPVEEVVSSDSGLLDMMIAFDTTGSMSSYIAAVRQHVTTLIPDLLKANPDMRIGIVAFGDYCDMVSAKEFGTAYQLLQPTREEKKLIDFVRTAKNTGGGDGDEFYELVLKKLIDETPWRKNAKKSILLIADADPHPLGYSYGTRVRNNQIDWREEAKRAASMGIQVDTLSIHGSAYKWYKELADLTNGVYAPFQKSENTAELVKMSALSRGGERTKDLFMANMSEYASRGNSEMVATSEAYIKNLS